jgi:hypothetical protein
MGFIPLKNHSGRHQASDEGQHDVLGLSMLSLTGFQIYHICDKKLFPYSLISTKRQRRIFSVKEAR